MNSHELSKKVIALLGKKPANQSLFELLQQILKEDVAALSILNMIEKDPANLNAFKTPLDNTLNQRLSHDEEGFNKLASLIKQSEQTPSTQNTNISVQGDDNVIAQGDGATAVGKGGVLVGGNVSGTIITGSGNTVNSISQKGAGEINFDKYEKKKNRPKILGDPYGGDKISVGNVTDSGYIITKEVRDTLNRADVFELSGEDRGILININKTLDEMHALVNDMQSSDDEESKKDLKNSLQKLNNALIQLPPRYLEKGDAIAQTTKNLLEFANSESPNKTLLRLIADSLNKISQELAVVDSAIIGITEEIVAKVMHLSGF